MSAVCCGDAYTGRLTNSSHSGLDPLTPDDIAEVIVFAASRRDQVVIADTLVYPTYQAGAGAVYRKPQ